MNAYNAKRPLSSDEATGPVSEATYGVLIDRRLEEAKSSSVVGSTDSASHTHAQDLSEITTLSIPLPILTPVQKDKLELALQSLLWDAKLPLSQESSPKNQNLEVLRTKGLISVREKQGQESVIRQHIIQGVKELYEMKVLPCGAQAEDSASRLVLIGRGLSIAVRENIHAMLSR